MEKTRKIKLIWDFRGMDSKQTAIHHEIHLKEFAIKENIDFYLTGLEEVDEFHNIAYLVVEEPNMISVRDALIPHRGTIHEEE